MSTQSSVKYTSISYWYDEVCCFWFCMLIFKVIWLIHFDYLIKKIKTYLISFVVDCVIIWCKSFFNAVYEIKNIYVF